MRAWFALERHGDSAFGVVKERAVTTADQFEVMRAAAPGRDQEVEMAVAAVAIPGHRRTKIVYRKTTRLAPELRLGDPRQALEVCPFSLHRVAHGAAALNPHHM